MLDLLNRWMPVDASQHGAALDSMNALVHWLMAVLFVGWGIYFVVALVKFRAGRNPRASYVGAKGKISKYSEVAVAVVEVVLLAGFAIPAWARWVTPPPADENPLRIRVIGEQFAWNVHYPGVDGVFGATAAELVSTSNPVGLNPSDPFAADDVTTINQLHLPVDRPITVLLSTKDVIHSFSLPVMRVKQDTIPGQEIPVHFTAKVASGEERWEIACAQLCGLGHYRMRGFLTVHPPGGFEAWLAEESPEPAPAAEPVPEPEDEGSEAAETVAAAGAGPPAAEPAPGPEGAHAHHHDPAP